MKFSKQQNAHAYNLLDVVLLCYARIRIQNAKLRETCLTNQSGEMAEKARGGSVLHIKSGESAQNVRNCSAQNSGKNSLVVKQHKQGPMLIKADGHKLHSSPPKNIRLMVFAESWDDVEDCWRRRPLKLILNIGREGAAAHPLGERRGP